MKEYKIAVVLPTHKLLFNDYEKLSLKFLNKYLKKYDKFLAIPEKLSKADPLKVFKDFKILKFENKYFDTYKGYNQLLKTSRFYKSFKEYDFILIYQTDCLVFNDDLQYHAKKGFDYIGAPWPIYSRDKKVKRFEGGNGGLSLRNVKRSILVTQRYESNFYNTLYFIYLCITLPIRLFKQKFLKIPQNLPWRPNEDSFWVRDANFFLSDFKIAPEKDALEFSFEQSPRECFKANNAQLPFGCHAFKLDLGFWKAYVKELDLGKPV